MMAETATIQSSIPPPYQVLFGHHHTPVHNSNNISKQSSSSSVLLSNTSMMESKSIKPSPMKSVTPKSLVKSTSSAHSATTPKSTLTTSSTTTKTTSNNKSSNSQNGVISRPLLSSGSSSSIASTTSTTSLHSARTTIGTSQRKSAQLESSKTSTTTSTTTKSSFRKPPVPNLRSSSQQSLPVYTPSKATAKVVTNTPSARGLLNSARNSNTLSARSNVSVHSPITPTRQISSRPQSTKVKDIVPSPANSLLIGSVPLSSSQPSSSRSTSSTSSTSSQFNSLLISNTYDDDDDEDFIVPETKPTTPSSSSSIAKKFNLTLNLSSITNNTPPMLPSTVPLNVPKKPPVRTVTSEPVVTTKKNIVTVTPVKTNITGPTASTSPKSTKKSNILHGGITSSTTLPRPSKKATPRTSNIVLEQHHEDSTPTKPSVTDSVEILSARPVVEDVIFNRSPSQASTSPKPSLITSPNHSEESSLSTSRSKQSSIYDEIEEYKNFEDKEIATLQQSFSKSSRSTLQTENKEEFWNMVDRSHTCILYESEKLYKLFCLWISEQQEQEIEDIYSSVDEKSRRDELAKLKTNSCVIYEEAFCEIVQYFLQLACKYSDDLLDHWCEFNCLDFFDFLDVKSCGAVSKESVFMILCLISSQICRKLAAFLDTFGDTLFEFCRPVSSKSSVSKTVNIHMTRKLAFICNIDDVQFTKSICKLGLANCETLKKEEVFKIYSLIFSRYDKGSLSEKGYFVPPMVTPIEDKHKAPISARTFGNISSRYHETPNSGSTLTYTSIVVETKSQTHEQVDQNEETKDEPQLSDRTPKVVYSSSKKIALPIRNNSNTQLVDTLSSDPVKTSNTKDLNSHTESIEENTSGREPKTDIDYIEQPKDKLFVSAQNTTNNGKGNKYLIETTPTPNNTPNEESKKKKKKRWKCCVM
ncbi:hypothetical protein NAEGRDRAFT_78093 [Naegleria gruberi]|uniref:EF-hand domain-containing protein n=1 Tax=Naegleria gruberi TaxID=5762 RepID=D2V0Z4_NAEGR|nr:uncharacterized protein NAEGRDRAFT_78093 [Naegleria gruberi]EFC49813.1 hypothetical protein NAEGRDRAFT_78093 [Naegleria gruberi]|eukprot:XP_002682557.1 hypothetical protein NAEGRDRAFT_78093 [Naegleria gruberi strain NEG-M]